MSFGGCPIDVTLFEFYIWPVLGGMLRAIGVKGRFRGEGGTMQYTRAKLLVHQGTFSPSLPTYFLSGSGVSSLSKRI